MPKLLPPSKARRNAAEQSGIEAEKGDGSGSESVSHARKTLRKHLSQFLANIVHRPGKRGLRVEAKEIKQQQQQQFRSRK